MTGDIITVNSVTPFTTKYQSETVKVFLGFFSSTADTRTSGKSTDVTNIIYVGSVLLKCPSEP